MVPDEDIVDGFVDLCVFSEDLRPPMIEVFRTGHPTRKHVCIGHELGLSTSPQHQAVVIGSTRQGVSCHDDHGGRIAPGSRHAQLEPTQECNGKRDPGDRELFTLDGDGFYLHV